MAAPSPPSSGIGASVSVPPGSQSGNFTIAVTFGKAVTGFVLQSLQHSTTDVMDAGNGVEGVHLFLSGSGDSYNIEVVLPDDKVGKFRIDFIGVVVPVETSGSMTEPIVADPILIEYDTRGSVSADVDIPTSHYIDEDFRVEIPIEYSENVIYFSKTDCDLISVSGDTEISDFVYYLSGSGKSYDLNVIPAPDRLGVFRMEITGHVLKQSTRRRENVEHTPVLAVFHSRIPKIIGYEAPDVLSGGMFDVMWELDVPDIGMTADGLIREGAVTGADLPEVPVYVYRYRGGDVVTLPDPPPAVELLEHPNCYPGWELTRSGVDPVPTRYLLFRFDFPSNAAGTFVVSPKPGALLPVRIG